MDMNNATVLLETNDSLNAHTMMEADNDSWILVIQLMRNIYTPALVGVGISGNILSCFVFSKKHMQKKPCSVLLTALSIVDIIFLLCLLITWLDREVYSLLRTAGACQCLIFTTYVTSFLSVWYIASITFERFVAVYFPMKCKRIFRRRTEKIIAITTVPIALVLYAYNFWTTTLITLNNHTICYDTRKSFNFLVIANWIDTILTMVIPFCLIAIANALIIRTLNRHPKDNYIQNARTESKDLTHSASEQDQDEVSFEVNCSQRAKSRNKITKTLVIISSTFLILNLPSHVMRLHNLIKTLSLDEQTVGIEFYFFQELASMLHYATFSCNFLLYASLGKDFRTALCTVFTCHSRVEIMRRTIVQLKSTRRHNITEL